MFAIWATKVHQHMPELMVIVMNGRIKANVDSLQVVTSISDN